MQSRGRKYDRAFKYEAVKLVIEGGRSVAEAGRDLGIDENLLHRWERQYLEDSEHAFSGKGRLKPPDEAVWRLERELADVWEERDILKKPWVSSQRDPDEVPVY